MAFQTFENSKILQGGCPKTPLQWCPPKSNSVDNLKVARSVYTVPVIMILQLRIGPVDALITLINI